MSAVALTAAQIAPVFADNCEIRTYIAGATITAGQAVYLNSSGDIDLADGNGSGTKQFKGIALNGGGAGQAIDVLRRGECYGFTITSAYDAFLYVSDTAGGLDTSAGTVTVRVGRISCLSDASRTKVLFVNADMTNDWA